MTKTTTNENTHFSSITQQLAAIKPPYGTLADKKFIVFREGRQYLKVLATPQRIEEILATREKLQRWLGSPRKKPATKTAIKYPTYTPGQSTATYVRQYLQLQQKTQLDTAVALGYYQPLNSLPAVQYDNRFPEVLEEVNEN